MPEAPELIYDADCGFCTRSARWLAAGQPSFGIRSWQSVDDLSALGLDEGMVTTAAYWIGADGQRFAGSDAIAAAMRAHGGSRGVLGRLIGAAPVRPLSRAVYGVIARHRHAMPGGTDACRLPTAPDQP